MTKSTYFVAGIMVGSLINKIKIFYKVLDEKYTNIAEIDFKALSKVKVAEM